MADLTILNNPQGRYFSDPAQLMRSIGTMQSSSSTVLVAYRTTDPHEIKLLDENKECIGSVIIREPAGRYMQAVQCLPAKGSVKIRRRLNFVQNRVSSCRDDIWLASMIQSTGTVQIRRCDCCQARQGPFHDCIALGDLFFPYARTACGISTSAFGRWQNRQLLVRSIVRILYPNATLPKRDPSLCKHLLHPRPLLYLRATIGTRLEMAATRTVAVGRHSHSP